MSKATFDETCPYCAEHVTARLRWESSDYASDFTFACTHCTGIIQVHVHSAPEFELSKLACQMCNAQIDDGHYCATCREKLVALSEHNRQRAEAAK
jgi:hypothetical protein